ncbi:MAG: D-alanyl-D-alanine carboxypeptidase [Chlorobiaceae bacterium]|nr:D-alanyl-D-alanine carboxypeptidase [Chlorobiaceae bacterium]
MICAAGALIGFTMSAEAAQYDVVASYLVKETGTSNVLMSKDIDVQVSPASLTKVMTSIMAIESGRMDEVVIVTREATLVEPTRAGLKEGDRIQLRDLVKAAMVNSSNDAAFAIAIHLGGSIESFVRLMNSRAKSLGMSNSCFTNPAGYDVGPWAGNRTTARDLMLLTEHAVRNPEFNAIARLDRATFRELSSGRAFSLKTHNKMLDLYPYTVGIKTGFTNRAGKCLIARAVKDRKDLLMVMLNARADRWAIASNMFDQGFGIGPGERMPMPVVARQDSDKATPRSSRQVAVNREKALQALRMEVARHGRSEAATAVKASRHEGKQQLQASRQKRLAAGKRDLKMKKLSALDRKLAMKASRGRSEGMKPALRNGRKAQDEKRLALRAGKAAKPRNVTAAKAGRKGKVERRAALNQKKKGGEVSRAMKQKHRKDALSFTGPAASGLATT